MNTNDINNTRKVFTKNYGTKYTHVVVQHLTDGTKRIISQHKTEAAATKMMRLMNGGHQHAHIKTHTVEAKEGAK